MRAFHLFSSSQTWAQKTAPLFKHSVRHCSHTTNGVNEASNRSKVTVPTSWLVGLSLSVMGFFGKILHDDNLQTRQELQGTRQEISDTRKELSDTRKELSEKIDKSDEKIDRGFEQIREEINRASRWFGR